MFILIGIFKAVKGLNREPLNKTLIKKNIRTCNSDCELDMVRLKKETGSKWFMNRIVNEWSKLNETEVAAKTIECVEFRLDKVMDEDGSQKKSF